MNYFTGYPDFLIKYYKTPKVKKKIEITKFDLYFASFNPKNFTVFTVLKTIRKETDHFKSKTFMYLYKQKIYSLRFQHNMDFKDL